MLSELIAPREWPSIAERYEMPIVRTIEEIRHARLMQLLESEDFPTIQAFADRIERSHAQVSQWKNRSKRKNKAGEVIGVSNIDSDSARLIESKTNKPTGWMDNDPVFDERPVTVKGPRTGQLDDKVDLRSRDVSDSEWDLLEDLRVLPEDELAELREKAAKNRRHVDAMIAKRQAAARQDKVQHEPREGAKEGGK